MDERLKEKDAYDIYYCLKQYSGRLDDLVEEFKPHIKNKLIQEGLAKLAKNFKTVDHTGPKFVSAFEEIADEEDRLIMERDAFERVNYQGLRKAGIFQKSDERILGDGDFVDSVLSDARKDINKRYFLSAKGIQIDDIISVVSELLSITPGSLIGPSKERRIVKGRALICFWAVRELGLTMTKVSEHLKVAVPTVSVAVKKGEQMVNDDGLSLAELLNIKI